MARAQEDLETRLRVTAEAKAHIAHALEAALRSATEKGVELAAMERVKLELQASYNRAMEEKEQKVATEQEEG